MKFSKYNCQKIYFFRRGGALPREISKENLMLSKINIDYLLMIYHEEKQNGLVDKGYAVEHVLQTLGRCIKSYDCPEYQRYEYLRLLAEANCNAICGCGTSIQLNLLVTKMAMIRDPALAGA